MGKAVSSVVNVLVSPLGLIDKRLGQASRAVGLVLLGATTGNYQLVAAGLAMGSSLLAPGAKAPKPSPASLDRLNASIDPRTPRKMVFGRTAMATDIRDQEYTDSNGYFHRFVVVASHAVQAIDEIWFDDKKAWTLAGGAQGDFAGFLDVTPVLEGSAANAINISARMGSTRRFTGCAYVHFKYKLTGNSSKTDSPFAQSIPTRMTIKGKGAKIYDPRLDSTAGGSGSQRADDQTTWAWDDDAARNLPLQLLWYLLGWRIQNPVTSEWKLAVGKAIPPDRIDLDSFITAANLSDEAVTKAVGGTEPRYRGDGVFSEGDDPSQVLDNFKAAMNAELDDIDGKIRITVLHNDLASPAAALTTSDVLGEFTWMQTPALNETFNVMRGNYVDSSDTGLFQMVDLPEVKIASPDGIDRIQQVPLQLVQSPSQGQRLVKQRLQRSVYGGTFKATFQATAWRYLKNDVVPFSFAPLGWVDKLFRIADLTIQPNGEVPMVLREEAEPIYAWDAEEAPAVVGVAPTSYSPAANPIVAAIEARACHQLISKDEAFPVTSDDTHIYVAAFNGVIDDGSAISVPTTTISGLTASTSYSVFYKLSDGTFAAEIAPALTRSASPEWLFLQGQTTSSSGSFPPPPPQPPGYGGDHPGWNIP